ncbi:MAG: hypothetical protein ACKO2L_04925 [Planctomycetaceae bacterium]
MAPTAPHRQIPRLLRTAPFVGWLLAVGFCGWFEWVRLAQLSRTPAGPLAWFFVWNHDTSLPLLVLATFPLLIFFARPGRLKIPQERFEGGPATLALQTLLPGRSLAVPVAVGLLAFTASASIGLRGIQIPSLLHSRSGELIQVPLYTLPPAYHDEFSYLLQARTFLSARAAWPAMTTGGDAFHQIHVLNRPVTASRYFPWTGLWIAPFLAAGIPVLGHWLAGGFAAALFCRILQKLVSPWAALIGGLLLAVSPGPAVFSNLLLAHHPTLIALAVFLYAFQNLHSTGRCGWAWLSGTALTCAMLGRPMTAAGFAAPFGIWLAGQIFRQWLGRRDGSPLQQIVSTAAGFAVPLAVGFLLLAAMNQRITGHWNQSPYQLYTDTWTPRHRFGFENAVQPPQPGNVLAPYDAWAENLTPALALRNLQHRLLASSQWTLGLAALLLLLPASCGLLLRRGATPERSFQRLLAAAVASMHLVHLPYWYDGIMHWHYVFETAPLLLMLAAVGLDGWQQALQQSLSRRVARLWLCSGLLAVLLPSWLDAESLWGASRVSMAVSEQAYSRVRMETFRRLTRDISADQPVLVLVDERSGDQQLSYIINPPDYAGPVLTARLPENAPDIAQMQQQFPNRTVWTFQPSTFTLRQLTEVSPR